MSDVQALQFQVLDKRIEDVQTATVDLYEKDRENRERLGIAEGMIRELVNDKAEAAIAEAREDAR